jgi:hypothetical protein
MRYLLVFLKAVIIIFSLCSFGYAENWTKFFSNAAGYDFYYNKDTIAYPNKDTILIWYRNVPQKETENKVWVEWIELREVDCSRRRYKRLQGRVTYEKKPMEDLNESSWIYLEPYDLDIAFYNTACVGK